MVAIFKGVELARTGKFDASTGPVTLTAEDFDNIASAYNNLKGKVDIPIKLGHDEQTILEAGGLPAAGWVENVCRVGDKLVGDLVGVPDAVGVLIKSGGLRKRSIEAIRNVSLAGKKWKFALTGLALLGSELPAVDSLQDITALYASGRVAATRSDTEGLVVIVMEAAPTVDDAETLIEELREVIDKIAATTAGKRGAPKLRHLLSVAVDELRRTGAVVRAGKNNQEAEDMDITELRTLLSLSETASEEEVLAALKEKIAPPKPEVPSGEVAAQIAKLSKDLTDTQTELVKLRDDKAKADVTAQVDDAIKARRFMPSSRDSLIKLAMHDTSAFADLVKGTPENAVLAPERGTSSSDGGVPAELEPSTEELKIAATLGLSKMDVIRSKAKAANIDWEPPKADEKK